MITICHSIKKVLLMVAFATSIVLLVSCGNNEKDEGSKVIAKEINEDKFNIGKLEKDAQFLVNVAEINLEQIQLGRLAQQKSETELIKEMGELLETGHTRSLYEINAIARNKMITLPLSITDDAQEDYEYLNEKSTNEFDEAYVDMIVSKQRDAVKAFDEASTERNDTDIKNWAAVSLPDMQKHLNHAMTLQRKYDTIKIN